MMEAVSPAVDSIRILAVDDHPVLRSGIAALLATQQQLVLSLALRRCCAVLLLMLIESGVGGWS